MTTLGSDVPAVTVGEATPEEGRALFESACRRELGVGADEFLKHLDAGEFPEGWPMRAVQDVEFLLPFIR